MNKIAIWTPINSKSGFGHFYRMLGLYETLKEQNYPIYYFTNKKYLLLEDIDILSFNSNNIDEIITFLIGKNIKILIIDNYEISTETVIKLDKIFKVIYFDAKFNNLEINSVINFNPYAIKKYKTKHKDTKYFLGLEYMNFRKSITKIKIKKPIKNSVFISIGGSDISSSTYILIPYLPKNKLYNIILGKGCSEEYYGSIKKIATKYKLNFTLFYQPSSYFDILNKSELAIISCSTSSYEMIYFSKPFICINVIENQDEITAYLSSKGIFTFKEDTLIKLSAIMNNGVKLNKSLVIKKNSNNKLVTYIKGLSNEQKK